jgi:hypothetical protein
LTTFFSQSYIPQSFLQEMGTHSLHEGLLRRLEDGESIASAPMNFLVLRFRALVLCDVLLCFGGFAVALEPSKAPAEVLSLDQAVTLAQENNRLIKTSHQSVLQANDQILAVRTQRYPHFNIQLMGSYLYLMRAPFGFMAFLGIASLIGVIVSHVIVLFDLIEEMHEKGEPLEEALLDAGIVRLRPVLITVGATILALFPLAGHGGPLWQPLCYAQIGGLGVATFITLLLVRVLYAIFVLDLKLVTWTGPASGSEGASIDSKGEPH